MADIIPLHEDPHRSVEMLLPWYVTGKLDEDERVGVDAHLQQCAQCRASLELDRRLGAEVRDLPLNVELGWEKLQHQLAPGLPDKRWAQPAARPRRAWLRVPTVGVAFAAALAAQVALLVGVVIAVRPMASRTEYHTLGSFGLRNDGNAVVMFVPDMTEQQLRDALGLIGARIVDGPTAAGAYVLHIKPDRRDAALETLRQRRDVLLAQPIDSEPPG